MSIRASVIISSRVDNIIRMLFLSTACFFMDLSGTASMRTTKVNEEEDRYMISFNWDGSVKDLQSSACSYPSNIFKNSSLNNYQGNTSLHKIKMHTPRDPYLLLFCSVLLGLIGRDIVGRCWMDFRLSLLQNHACFYYSYSASVHQDKASSNWSTYDVASAIWRYLVSLSWPAYSFIDVQWIIS